MASQKAKTSEKFSEVFSFGLSQGGLLSAFALDERMIPDWDALDGGPNRKACHGREQFDDSPDYPISKT
jgi:hypothetical protein